MMFLFHFAGFSYSDVMEMPHKEIYNWTAEAIKLFKKINGQ